MLGSAIMSTVVIMGTMGSMSFGAFAMCVVDCCGKKSDIADVVPLFKHCRLHMKCQACDLQAISEGGP